MVNNLYVLSSCYTYDGIGMIYLYLPTVATQITENRTIKFKPLISFGCCRYLTNSVSYIETSYRRLSFGSGPDLPYIKMDYGPGAPSFFFTGGVRWEGPQIITQSRAFNYINPALALQAHYSYTGLTWARPKTNDGNAPGLATCCSDCTRARCGEHQLRWGNSSCMIQETLRPSRGNGRRFQILDRGERRSRRVLAWFVFTKFKTKREPHHKMQLLRCRDTDKVFCLFQIAFVPK